MFRILWYQFVLKNWYHSILTKYWDKLKTKRQFGIRVFNWKLLNLISCEFYVNFCYEKINVVTRVSHFYKTIHFSHEIHLTMFSLKSINQPTGCQKSHLAIFPACTMRPLPVGGCCVVTLMHLLEGLRLLISFCPLYTSSLLTFSSDVEKYSQSTSSLRTIKNNLTTNSKDVRQSLPS